MALDEVTIVRGAEWDWLDLTGKVPGSEGVSIKLHRADEESGRVVLAAKFAPNSRMPRHVHHCTAFAYTVSGSWSYDEGTFYAGDMAIESLGNNHLPWGEEGTEMVICFDSPSGQYLDNQLDDGTCFHMGMPLFKQIVGMSAADWADFNILAHVEFLPEMRKAA